MATVSGIDAFTTPNEDKLMDVEECEQQQNKYVRMGISDADADFYDNYPAEKRKALFWKVDVRLVPFLALLYLASHIDRANIGNAKIEGMTEDLGLTGIQYNIALSIFFVPYILLEVPSNLLLRKFKRPSTYIGLLVVSWGIVMTFTGVVKNFAGLMICRVLLGITEAGFFPGAVYLITQWYIQNQLQTRIAIFFCASALSGAFSGLLAFAIAKMDGVGNRPGWAWIFLIEGMATVLLGAACFFMMPDTPALSRKWLTNEEVRYLEIQNDIREGGKYRELADKFRWGDLWAILTDYKIYLQMWILFAATTCSYGIKFTMPSVTKSMGFTSSQAQLLTIPPYVVGAVSAVVFGKLSDRFMWRLPFIVIPLTLIVVGFAVILPLAPNISHNVAGCYVGVVLICMGIYPTNPAGSAWISGNLAGPSKKAMGIAFNICMGNLGGIVGSYIFLSEEAPGYPTGFGTGLAVVASAVLSSLLLEYSYWSINKKREAMDQDDIQNKYTHEELSRMGDNSPLFRYTL